MAIRTNKITVLNSDNDPYISVEIAQRTAKKLGADLVMFKNKFHLNEGTNKGEFPELLEMILETQGG